MANKVFIRSDKQPTARLGYGDNCPAFECDRNVLFVDENDTAMLFAMAGEGFEEVAAGDPRYDWITTQGWSRQAQRDYARQPIPEEPEQ